MGAPPSGTPTGGPSGGGGGGGHEAPTDETRYLRGDAAHRQQRGRRVHDRLPRVVPGAVRAHPHQGARGRDDDLLRVRGREHLPHRALVLPGGRRARRGGGGAVLHQHHRADHPRPGRGLPGQRRRGRPAHLRYKKRRIADGWSPLSRRASTRTPPTPGPTAESPAGARLRERARSRRSSPPSSRRIAPRCRGLDRQRLPLRGPFREGGSPADRCPAVAAARLIRSRS